MLVDVDNKGHQLEEKAAVAFLAMYKAAVADGVNLVVNSATRDSTKQTKLYADYVVKLKNWEGLGSNPASKPMPVAKPGTSEHEIGNAVDINQASSPNVLPWLIQHARTFGFYATALNERWHWAYYNYSPPTKLLERHEMNVKRWSR